MRVLWGFSRQGLYVATAYRAAYWAQLANLLVKIYIVFGVWTVLYDHNPGSFPVSRQSMVAYAVVSAVMGQVLSWWEGPHVYIQSQIRRGTVVAELLRPVYFPLQIFFRLLGEQMATVVVVLLPTVFLVMLTLSPALPTWTDAALFALSFALSYITLFCMNFMLGLLSFRTLSIFGFQLVYHGAMTLLSGLWIPLWFYPGWLHALVDALPFRGIFYTPLSIYVGLTHGPELSSSLISQAVWAVVFAGAAVYAWAQTHRHLVVQGG